MSDCVTSYQPSGRDHIKYIRKIALHIWTNVYNSNSEEWRNSIRLALKRHRDYLIMTQRMIDNARKKEKTIKGTFWRNPTTGIWEPLTR